MTRKSKQNQQVAAPTVTQRYLFPPEVMERLKRKAEERRRWLTQKSMEMGHTGAGKSK